MNRRKYLSAIGCATTAILAGCGGGGGGGGGGGNESGGTTTGGGGGNAAGGAATEASTPVEGGETTTDPTTSGAGATTVAESTRPATVTSARGPSPTATAGSTPASTATTGGSGSSAASIGSSEFTKATEFGITEAAVVGELTASARLQSIELRATFRNDAGDVLGTEPAFFQGLDQGQTWNFYVPFLGDGAAATDAEVEVASATTGPAPPSPPAEVIESTLNPSPDEFTGPTVTGRARNTGSSTLPYLEARVKFLADDGTALDSDFTNVVDLPASETWSFEVEQLVFSSDERPEASDYEITLAG